MQKPVKIFLIGLISFIFTSLSFPFEIEFPLPVDARVIGIGEVFAGICDLASCIYYNPAGLLNLKDTDSFVISYQLNQTDAVLRNRNFFYGIRGKEATRLFWGIAYIDQETKEVSHFWEWNNRYKLLLFPLFIQIDKNTGMALNIKKQYLKRTYKAFPTGFYAKYSQDEFGLDFAVFIKMAKFLNIGGTANFISENLEFDSARTGVAIILEPITIGLDVIQNSQGKPLFNLGAEMKLTKHFTFRLGMCEKPNPDYQYNNKDKIDGVSIGFTYLGITYAFQKFYDEPYWKNLTGHYLQISFPLDFAGCFRGCLNDESPKKQESTKEKLERTKKKIEESMAPFIQEEYLFSIENLNTLELVGLTGEIIINKSEEKTIKYIGEYDTFKKYTPTITQDEQNLIIYFDKSQLVPKPPYEHQITIPEDFTLIIKDSIRPINITTNLKLKELIIEDIRTNITINNLQSLIKVKDHDGKIILNFLTVPEGENSIQILEGELEINLPEDAKFFIDAKTNEGEIIIKDRFKFEGEKTDSFIKGSVNHGEKQIFLISSQKGNITIK